MKYVTTAANLAHDRGRGSCECGNETSGSKKCGQFLD